MFGYIRVYSPELLMRENEYYRAAYCGLCRAYGRCTGCGSRFALSYDFVFLALVRIALTGESVGFEPRRCAAHPMKKRSGMVQNAQLEYCARAAALLTYHKLCDDVRDESGTRRLRARMALLLARGMRRRAAAALPGLDGKISAALDTLAELEREKTASVDIPAEVFGRITEEILAYGLDGDSERIARRIGRHIGKWIYIADALDDYPDDVKRSRYNPFASLWGDGMTKESRESIRTALVCELQAAECAFDLIEYGGCHGDTLSGLVSNIIYRGMPRRVDEILKGDMCHKTREEMGADE